MAEIVLNLWVDVGIDITAKAGNAHELLGILEDPEFQELLARYKPVEPLGATETAAEPEVEVLPQEPVLSESEALEALKRELGASLSPTDPYQVAPDGTITQIPAQRELGATTIVEGDGEGNVTYTNARLSKAQMDAKAAFLQKYGKDK